MAMRRKVPPRRLLPLWQARRNILNPDGVPIMVDWSVFVPGASVFIPCINSSLLVSQVRRLAKRRGWQISTAVKVETSYWGVRVWRLT